MNNKILKKIPVAVVKIIVTNRLFPQLPPVSTSISQLKPNTTLLTSLSNILNILFAILRQIIANEATFHHNTIVPLYNRPVALLFALQLILDQPRSLPRPRPRPISTNTLRPTNYLTTFYNIQS